MLAAQTISPQDFQHFVNLVDEFLNYSSSKAHNKTQFKEIENQLKNFSKNDSFFQVAFQFIVNKPNVTYEQLFIVSLLLRDKFRYEFDKYSDEESVVFLQNMLKQILTKYNTQPSDTFSTNICICIICLYIKRAQQMKVKYQELGILEYYKSFVFGNVCSDYFYKALEYTPEEIYSSKIVIDEIKKQTVKSIVKSSQYQVLKHLNQVAPNLWDKKVIKKNHLFSAFQNWISIGYKETLFHELPNHFLAQKLFDNCLDSTVSSEATECLKSIIKRLKSSKRDEVLFSFLGNGVFKLVNQIKSHLKEYGDTNEVSQAIEVITDFGILATDFFIENYNSDVRNFLQSTIEFLKIEDLDVFPNLLDFWEGFINEIHNTGSLNNEYVELMKNAYAAVCYKTTWKLEMIIKMNDISERNLCNFYSEAEYIIERRDEAQNFFEVLALAFGQQNYLDFVLSCITQLNKNQPEIFWPFFESYLNSLKDALKNFPTVSKSVHVLVTSYGQVSEYVKIKLGYLTLFKNLMTIKEPSAQIKSQFIQHLFTLIAENMRDPKIEERAQKAFSKGCEQNPEVVINYLQNFIKLLKQHEGSQQILKGVMYVLGSNFYMMQKYLPLVLQVLFEIFSAADTSIKKKSIYHSLYALFKILMSRKEREQYKDAVIEFTKQIWPQVINALNEPKDIQFDQDPGIERAVKLVKFIMRCLRESFIPFLQSLFTTVFQAYRKYPICSYIYVLEVAITVFYEDQTLIDYFRSLYQNFCQITYAHLKEKQNIEDYQLLIDDFIGMNKRFFIYNSRIVLQSGELPSIIQTCINLSNITEVPQISKSVYQFFETIFMVYWSEDFIKKYNENEFGDKFEKNIQSLPLYTQLKSFILPKLASILVNMIQHLEKVPLQATAFCILDALMSQIKAFPDSNQQIWTPILESLPRQILTNSEKGLIYENLHCIGSSDIDQSRQAAYEVQKLIYRMNKRFINNHKRRF